MTLAWIFTAAMIVKDIVYEKERRLKEVMKVMGLGNAVHWVSWFITSFLMMLLSVFLLVIVLKVARISPEFHYKGCFWAIDKVVDQW